MGMCCATFGGDPLAPLGTSTPVERRHWAFRQRTHPEIPKFNEAADQNWAGTPLDAFILARLKKEGLRPSPPADRAALIRRACFDLTGLPPTPADVASFVIDRSPDAWENLVERLLASRHSGERWAQHWLDVAGFSETDGFEYDTHRRDAWRYRDYVIRAFNNDKPYDRFLLEQLAGDEIAPQEDEDLIAAGFNRLGPLRKNAGNQEVASSRNEELTEMTNIFSAAVLGVTIGCARCHDHKFDPFRQSDYYRLQAYFAQVQPNDLVLANQQEQADWKVKAAPGEQEKRRLQMQLRRAPDGEKAPLELQLDALDDTMPAPLAAIYTVTDDGANASPIPVRLQAHYLSP